jgi:hypothetical protein
VSREYIRTTHRVGFNAQSPAERDHQQAPRPTPREPTYHYIYSGGKRYKVYDANEVVDRLSELNRPGWPG